MPRLIVAISLCLAAFVACGGDDTTKKAETETPSPSAEATADPGASYASVEAVARALKKNGLGCTPLTPLKQKDPTLKEFALCDVGDAASRLNIYLFDNETRRNEWMGDIVQTGLPWVFGPNWIIVGAGDPTTAQARVVEVRDAIGGSIPEIQTQTATP